MTKEELLKAGIEAARAGNFQSASSFFSQVVKMDPSSEQGWLALGMCCSAPSERAYCLKRVLAINPGNAEARKQLERVSNFNPTPPPSWASQPPPAQTKATPSDSSLNSLRESFAESVEKPLPPPPTWAQSKAVKPQAVQQKRKKQSNKTALYVGLVLVTLICLFGGAFLLLSGTLTRLVPANGSQALPPTQTLAPALPTSSPTLPPPTLIPSPIPTVAYTPRFEKAACPFDFFWNADVSCGYLIVPEDRTGDPSDTIRLAVAVFKSFSPTPAEPVIFLQGGPGGEAVQLSADAYEYLVEPFLEKRDFIAFDQRGTGLSAPTLECDEVTKTFLQDIHGLLDPSTRELIYSNSFLSCQGLMTAQGINLNAYTTVESAADVKDLVTMLGYQKVDLYGASYGTRLAQVVMRDHPEIVNAAILDSVVPVETSLFEEYPLALESGLKTLFINCAIDPECSAAYPNLEVVFWDVVAKLDANPVTITTSDYPRGTITETVTGGTVLNIILASIKHSYFAPTAPQSIYRFKDGDFSTLVIAQDSLPFAFEGISSGLFITMMCHENVMTTTVEDALAASPRQIIEGYVWLPFYGDVENVIKTCKSWGSKPPFYGENAPTVSDIPSLIISGSYDPTTPPMYAKRIAEHLSHSYYFEFPNLGHVPTAIDGTGCAQKIALEFLDNPTAEPDRSCMNDLKPVKFVVPYTGNPPYELETKKVYGVRLEAPKSWIDLGGFYYRGNSPFDITEVGILQIPMNSGDIQNWFNLEAYGYRGLDGPLVEAGKRESNGMVWTLLTSSSYGRPVDIAMTDDGGWSLLILLFSNNDEHEALYRTVFLPMVDSTRR